MVEGFLCPLRNVETPMRGVGLSAVVMTPATESRWVPRKGGRNVPALSTQSVIETAWLRGLLAVCNSKVLRNIRTLGVGGLL